MAELEARTIRKVMWRLMPFLMFCYFMAFLDRVNVGFAHLQMSEALRMSEVAFGFGAGIFFIGYFLVEVPSNIILARFGARRWIARIMLSWGVVSASFGFIPQLSAWTGLSTEACFYILRFLLGICEAGFYPGVVFYLTKWFPQVYRARAIAFFMLAVPVSSVIGAPLSGFLLNITGLGMQGWQWLYILEGIPSILLSVAVFCYLTDEPRDALWLQKDQIDWLQTRIAQERALAGEGGHSGLVRMMLDIRILMCAFANFSMQGATYSITLFLPALVSQLGYSNSQTGLILAFPPFFGAIGMVLFSRHSDRTGERKFHVAAALLMLALGIAGGALFENSVIRLLCFTLANIGSVSLGPMLYPIPTAFLPKSTVAAGIAVISSLGALGGFVGPYLFGYLKSVTGGPTTSLLLMACLALAGAIVSAALRVGKTQPILQAMTSPR
ncbi:MAG TPA: MFS transporter [Rhizomicrobium sp.]|nr:MFS transporter [Rhizomicrobium sp.]